MERNAPKESHAPPATLPGLDSRLFEHPSDRMALKALRRVPFLERLTAGLLDHFSAAETTRLVAGSLEVTEDALPDIFRMYREVAEVLGLAAVPSLFVEAGDSINAYTTGADQPLVVVTENAVTRLAPRELSYVLGHELGHVMAGHVRYRCLAQALAIAGGSLASTMPIIGDIGLIAINATLIPALDFWGRRSEYTADRAGALACQDWNSVWRAKLKLMGYPATNYSSIDVGILFRQAKKYHERMAENFSTRFSELNQTFTLSHPRMVARALELAEWRDDGSYDELVHLDRAGREAMMHLIEQDPVAHALLSVAGAALCNWATGEFNLPLDRCGPPIRRMVRGNTTSPEAPLDSILHMELSVRRQGRDDYAYAVNVLRNRNGLPVRVAVPVPWSAERTDVPDELRAEMMRDNADHVVRVLYTVGSAREGGAACR